MILLTKAIAKSGRAALAIQALHGHAKRLFGIAFNWWFVAALAAAAALRFIKLSPQIDAPHEWRQCDTASYTRNFFRDGIDLFAPSVNWLGAHKTLILEFPLPEAVVALVYRLLWPSLIFDRLVYLAFFAGGVIYLYYIVRAFHERFVAQMCVVVYCFLPLSIYFSRAIHIDFTAIFFAHAFLYHAIAGYRQRSAVHLLVALAVGIIAFLVKAPYIFYLVLPLAVVVLSRFNWRWAIAVGAVVAVCVGVFGLFRAYADAVNAQIPDLSFLPYWYPFINRGWWYYGTLAQRLNLSTWLDFLYALPVRNLMGEPGLWLAVIGLGISIFGRRQTAATKLFFLAWTAGVAVYVLIFFNLNLIMNYYQIPMLAIWAYYIAITIDFARTQSRLGALALCGALIISFIPIARSQYFWAKTDMYAASDVIAANTPKDALVIAVDPSVSTYDYPCSLYAADRFGWSVNPSWLNWEIVSQLKAQGATHLAIHTNHPWWEKLHDCDFCGKPLVQHKHTIGNDVVSVFQLNP